MALKVNSKTAVKKPANRKNSTRKSCDVMKEQLHSAVAHANKIGELLDKRLSFDIDRKMNKVIVKVVDRSSGNIVRVIPPDEMLRMAAHLKQLMILNDRVIDAAESVILDHEC
ncbi:flagellar protein FlaG [bacterium BMS3Bbin09]|nr:flagellar protein FlaG [bacterium BMS3Bbin09]